MIGMEYRGFVRVPGIDIEGDRAGDLLDVLEERHGSFGPVLGGVEGGVEVIISLDQPDDDETRARTLMLGVVSDALISGGFEQLPSGIELERVADVARR
jgi:hypothetical protein